MKKGVTIFTKDPAAISHARFRHNGAVAAIETPEHLSFCSRLSTSHTDYLLLGEGGSYFHIKVSMATLASSAWVFLTTAAVSITMPSWIANMRLGFNLVHVTLQYVQATPSSVRHEKYNL